MRSIYLQRRNYLVYDGNVPDDPFDVPEDYIDGRLLHQASIDLMGESSFELFPLTENTPAKPPSFNIDH